MRNCRRMVVTRMIAAPAWRWPLRSCLFRRGVSLGHEGGGRMKTVRSLANSGSTTRRLVFMLGIAVALIAGLLAMHTLTAGTTHLESTPAISSAADHDQAMAGAAVEDTAVDAGHCLGDCGAPGNKIGRASCRERGCQYV